MNWDAGVNVVNGRMSIGIVIPDFERHVIVARSLTQMRNLEPAVAKTLQLSRQLNLVKIGDYNRFFCKMTWFKW